MLGELAGRIDRMSFSCLHIISAVGVLIRLSDSPASSSPKSAARRVHAVRLQMDELPTHARTERSEYSPDVGYIPCASFLSSLSSTEERKWMIERRLEFVLRIPLVRLLRIPQALEEQVNGNGFPGTPSPPGQPFFIFTLLHMSTRADESVT